MAPKLPTTLSSPTGGGPGVLCVRGGLKCDNSYHARILLWQSCLLFPYLAFQSSHGTSLL